MPARSAIAQLPDADREWLEQQLLARRFGGYAELAELLGERGYAISKSALHRWGQKFEERAQALQIATQQARAIVEHAPDDEGAMSEALMRLVQEKLFTALMELEVNPASLNIGVLAQRIAELGRATVTQKKWATEVREKTRAAAEAAEQIARRGGLSGEAVDSIKREILGIAA